jgi:hypothetical protein
MVSIEIHMNLGETIVESTGICKDCASVLSLKCLA